jgi:CheY-like chemotaxis protein
VAESLKGSVLLVDDDPAVAKVLGALLVQAGLIVHTASNGQEALTLLGRKPIDVVVSDVRMPGMSGLGLLAEVGRSWPDVPVILLTAHGTVPLQPLKPLRGDMQDSYFEMLNFFVPPLEASDRRYDELIASLKGLFPDRPLAWAMIDKDEEMSTSRKRHSYRVPPLVPVTSARDAVVEAVAAGHRTTLLDDPKSPCLAFMVDGKKTIEALNGERMTTVKVSVPSESLRGDRGMDVVAACGDALAAHHMAHMADAASHVVFLVQSIDDPYVVPAVEEAVKTNPCLRSLPRLWRVATEMPSPNVPLRLGEWNYWSAATSKLLGDLEPGRDEEWLACSRKTPAGGTVLRLADGAFDPMRSDHCAQLLRAYERFSGVGARLT